MNLAELNIFFKDVGYNVWLLEFLGSKEIIGHQGDLRKALIKQVDAVVSDSKKFTLLTSKEKKAKADQRIKGILDSLWSANSLSKWFKKTFDLLLTGANFGGRTAFDKLQVSGTFDLKNTSLIAKLGQREALLIESVDKTTKKWLGDTIADGLDQGLSNDEIAKGITSAYEDISDWRAKAIITTEIANAGAIIEHEVYRRTGVVKKKWITMRDELVCTSICEPLGKLEPVGIDDPFVIAEGVFMLNPAHVNCRCFIYPIWEGWIDEDRLWEGA